MKPPRGRRGQTILLAMGVLFLLVLLGGMFVTMVVSNLRRSSYQGETDDALTLAVAGLQYAAQQFKNSEEGMDWRPRPTEALWRTPNPPTGVPAVPVPVNSPGDNNPPDSNLNAAELRALDPDQQWLSDGGKLLAPSGAPTTASNPAAQPFVRIATGRGRFLLRVTYLPSFQASSSAAETATQRDEFDPNSGMIHIESVGRPGEFDSTDPSFFAQDPTTAGNTRDIGPYRKVEAFVPVGLVDQLLWITNRTNERGPANLGVPPYTDATGVPRECPTLLEGAIRSNVDIQWQGRNVVRLYPARGEAIQVNGQMLFTRPQAQTGAPQANVPHQLLVDVVDDNGQPAAGTFPAGPQARPVLPPDNHEDNPEDDGRVVSWAPRVRTDPAYNPDEDTILVYTSGQDERRVVLDDRFARGDTAVSTAQAIRFQKAPDLDQKDPVTGVSRWLTLTRDSGASLRVTDASAPGGSRLVNTGWYGLTDEIPPAGRTSATQADWERIRARGLYLDNFGDIQYPGDRDRVKDEWLRRKTGGVSMDAWLGDHYIPSVREDGVFHPIAEVLFTRMPRNISLPPDNATNPIVPKIVITRFDLDRRQMNFPPATGRLRQFHELATVNTGAGTGTLTPVGQTRIFDWPRNGVFYAEGSIRVRGSVGVNTAMNGSTPNIDTLPRGLTVVSGGTIYVEGNLVKANPGWQIALMAKDYVTLNPTLFTRVNPGNAGVVADQWDDITGLPTNYHFELNQNTDSDLDVSFTTGQNLGQVLMHLKHTGVQEDIFSQTAVTLMKPRLTGGSAWPQWGTDNFDWGANPLDLTNFTPTGQPYYLFQQPSAGVVPPNLNWAESGSMTVGGSPANYERKSFLVDGIPAMPGADVLFRFITGLRLAPSGPNAGTPEPVPNGTPYWLSKVAFVPPDRPLQVRVEAAIYAFNGSWFIIPPPFFNNNPQDTRARYFAQFAQTGQWRRADGTLPGNVDGDPNNNTPLNGNPGVITAAAHYPFYGEPLNVEVRVVGSITENVTASPGEAVAWTRQMWTNELDVNPAAANADNDPAAWPPTNPDDPSNWLNGGRARSRFSPRISYRYDHNFRRMVRARVARTGREEVVWVAPAAPAPAAQIPAGMRTLAQFITQEAVPADSFVETLPLLPRLPATQVIYEGNSL